MMGQFPSGNGSSIPSHIRCVDALRPAWPSCTPIFDAVFRRMNSTIFFHALMCSGLYIPVHPGEIRPSRETSVISVNTSPAPPIARLPRCTRCHSFGMPSSATYWHIGETTTRLLNTRSRSLNGVNMGGLTPSAEQDVDTPVCFSASPAYHVSTYDTNCGSRILRLSCVILRLRVSKLNANCGGSRRTYRSVSSNHCR